MEDPSVPPRGGLGGRARARRGAGRELAAPYGVHAELTYTRNVPPVDNDESSVALLAAAVEATEGPEAIAGTEQSLGGEDFAWYLADDPRGAGPPGRAQTGADRGQ